MSMKSSFYAIANPGCFERSFDHCTPRRTRILKLEARVRFQSSPCKYQDNILPQNSLQQRSKSSLRLKFPFPSQGAQPLLALSPPCKVFSSVVRSSKIHLEPRSVHGTFRKLPKLPTTENVEVSLPWLLRARWCGGARKCAEVTLPKESGGQVSVVSAGGPVLK
jgi:hypothetical protein